MEKGAATVGLPVEDGFKSPGGDAIGDDLSGFSSNVDGDEEQNNSKDFWPIMGLRK